jgi:hypothetical protein
MPKRKRPLDLHEKTVCLGLKKNLLAPSLLPGIESLVDNISRRTHRASLLLNHYILSKISDRNFDVVAEALKDQMFYYSALSLSRSKNYSALIDFFERNKTIYESINKISGSGASANAAARQMKTNVSNYLWMTFDDRLRRLTKKSSKQEQKFIIATIRGKTPYHQMALDRQKTNLVERCREILATDEVVYDRWIADHPGRVMRLYHFLLQQCEQQELKGFTILPVFQMKAHFTTIDAATLRFLLVDAGELPDTCSQEDFNTFKCEHFASVFRTRGKWTLGNEVKTDGFSLRMNVWRTEHNVTARAELPKKDEMEELESKRTEPKNTTRDVENTTKKKRKKDKNEPQLNPHDLLLPGDDTDYFSNDPGERNQAYVHHTVGGVVVRKARLTSKQFRLESHRSEHIKRMKKWLSEVQEENTILSQHPLRTSSAETFKQHLVSKIPLYERLWKWHLNPRMARARWDYHIHSWSCIDRFWSKLAYDKPAGLPLHRRPLLKYGAGKWGDAKAPNRKMLESAKKYFRIVMVPEYNTSQCCATCGSRMEKVTRKFIGPLQEGKRRYSTTIRDLKFCRSNACRSTPLKSRDGNAATNIGIAYPDRPGYLCP